MEVDGSIFLSAALVSADLKQAVMTHTHTHTHTYTHTNIDFTESWNMEHDSEGTGTLAALQK